MAQLLIPKEEEVLREAQEDRQVEIMEIEERNLSI